MSPALFEFPHFAPGEVWLVGAGPGDPRLLTLFAVHALETADQIFYDALVEPRILRLAKPQTILSPSGKRGGKPSAHQSDINDQIIAAAREGRRVVRLKGGDPLMFGRGGEEMRALADAGVRFRIIPGLSAGLTGPALAGIPATIRTTNHAIILTTGHRAVDAETSAEWQRLAQTGQPMIFFMAMTRLSEISEALLLGGLSADLPAAIIENAATSNERFVETALGSLALDAAAYGCQAPAIVVIGEIVTFRRELRGFLAPWHLEPHPSRESNP